MSRNVYKPEYCDRVRELGKQGCSIGGASEKLGIHCSTMLYWERTKPEFRKAFERIRANSERFKARRFERLLQKTEAQLLEALRRVREKRQKELERLKEKLG